MEYRYKTTTNNSGSTIVEQLITKVSDIPNLLFHFDASGLALDTTNTHGVVDALGNVSQWNNLASSNHLIQATSLNQPTLNISGSTNSVLFNGSSSFFTFINSFNLNRCTILFIFKPTVDISSTSASQIIIGPDSGQTIDTYWGMGNLSSLMVAECMYFFSYKTDNTYRGSYSRWGPISSSKINALTVVNNDYVNIVAGYDSTLPFGVTWTDEIYKFRVNPPEYTLINSRYFGTRKEGIQFLSGKVYELLIIDRAINDDEILYLKNYINIKYGI